MTSTEYSSSAGQWKLTGITPGSGQCDYCPDALTQRVFQVEHPDLGIRHLDCHCAARVTGYAANDIEWELARIVRMAELDERRAIIAAARPEFGKIYADMLAWQAMSDDERASASRQNPGIESFRLSGIFSLAVTTDAWWDGGKHGWGAYGTWTEYVDACIARAA